MLDSNKARQIAERINSMRLQKSLTKTLSLILRCSKCGLTSCFMRFDLSDGEVNSLGLMKGEIGPIVEKLREMGYRCNVSDHYLEIYW